MDPIKQCYDKEYDERERLERHKIEFEITKRYMDNYITGQNQRIFDIGGGQGRYSFYLTQKGHRVTLLDLSRHNIHVARGKSRELDIWLEDYIKGNALDLSIHESESYDVVLLMGPLYHLIKEEDRQKAMVEALRVLKKDGIFIASFISNYAPIQDASKEEARLLMQKNGLQELAFAGVENILGCKETDILKCTKENQEKWLELGFALSQEESLMGTSQHYLYIGQKK